MTDREKLELIKRMVLNISPIDYTNEQHGLGASHALCIAIECVIESKEEDE